MSTPNTSSSGPQPHPSTAPETTAPKAPTEGQPARPARARKVLTPESLALHMHRLDLVLVLVVLVFAFLVASFAARNSDLWMDLATGRLLAEGHYTFGADPFAFTTPRTGWAWINHAWLYDWAMYRIAQAFGGIETPAGGAALVAIKAVLITILAGVMVWIGRRGHTLWVPAAVVALALLAMSPWLLLQPKCLSLLFLALTLALLYWPRRDPATATPTVAEIPRHWLLLPLLFVLWVNLDDWFLLGPLTVGLYLLGEAAQLYVTTGFPGAEAPRSRELRILAGILLLGMGACLFNPYHIHAFTLPLELAIWLQGSGLQELLPFPGRFASPLTGAYVAELGTTKNWAGFAYYVLFLVGIVSFIINRAAWRFSRLLLWLVFALLSIGLAGTIPFFGVVGAVVSTINFQEWAVRRLGTTPQVAGRLQRWSIAGRYLSLAAGVAVLVLAWPGFLHPGPDNYDQTHRVAWQVDVDPSYRQAALRLGELRDRNALAEGMQGFNFLPELGDYFAWFCPREKSFLDHRLPLFAHLSGTFRDVRRALTPDPGQSEGPASTWQTDFRNPDAPINHVIVSATGGRLADQVRRRELFAVFFRLWDDPAQWTMLYGDGRTFIFGWNDPDHPAKAAAFAGHAVHFNTLAFGPEVPVADRSPGQGPELPAARTLWKRFLQGPAPPPLERNTAVMYQLLYSHLRGWPTVVAPLQRLGTGAEASQLAPTGGGIASLSLATAQLIGTDPMLLQDYLLRGQDPDPAALLFLAVRSARQAVAANPGDAASYGRLGLIYRTLSLNYETPWTGGSGTRLRELRQVQTVTALQRAVRFQPDNPDYHHFLADEFLRLNFPDLTLYHREQSLAAVRAAGPHVGETVKDFQDKLQAMEQELKALEKQTQLPERQKQLDKLAANASPLGKGQVAFQLGLAKAALETFRAMDPSLLNEQEQFILATLESKLLILTGQGPENVDLAQVKDLWDRVLLAAADGNYTRVDEYLEEIQFSQERSPQGSAVANLLQRLQNLTFQGRLTRDVWGGIAGSTRAPLDWADVAVVRGSLALEVGDTGKALGQFRRAQAWYFQPIRLAALIAPLGTTTQLGENLLWPFALPHVQDRFPFAAQQLVFRYVQLLEAAERHP